MAVFISAQEQNSSVVLKNVNSNRADKIGNFNFNNDAYASTLELIACHNPLLCGHLFLDSLCRVFFDNLTPPLSCLNSTDKVSMIESVMCCKPPLDLNCLQVQRFFVVMPVWHSHSHEFREKARVCETQSLPWVPSLCG